MKSGFWVILQEMNSEKVVARCYKFSADFNNDYSCSSFGIKEADYGSDFLDQKLQYIDLGVSGRVLLCSDSNNDSYYMVSDNKIESLQFKNDVGKISLETIMEVSEGINIQNSKKAELFGDKILIFSYDNSIYEARLKPKDERQSNSKSVRKLSEETALVNYDANEIRK